MIERFLDESFAAGIGKGQNFDGAKLREGKFKNLKDSHAVAEIVEIGFLDHREGHQVVQVRGLVHFQIFHIRFVRGLAAIVIRHGIPRALQEQPLPVQRVGHVAVAADGTNPKNRRTRICPSCGGG